MGILPLVAVRRDADAALGHHGGVTAVLPKALLVSPPPWSGPGGVWVGALLDGSPPPLYCKVTETPAALVAPVTHRSPIFCDTFGRSTLSPPPPTFPV